MLTRLLIPYLAEISLLITFQRPVMPSLFVLFILDLMQLYRLKINTEQLISKYVIQNGCIATVNNKTNIAVNIQMCFLIVIYLI